MFSIVASGLSSTRSSLKDPDPLVLLFVLDQVKKKCSIFKTAVCRTHADETVQLFTSVSDQ